MSLTVSDVPMSLRPTLTSLFTALRRLGFGLLLGSTQMSIAFIPRGNILAPMVFLLTLG